MMLESKEIFPGAIQASVAIQPDFQFDSQFLIINQLNNLTT